MNPLRGSGRLGTGNDAYSKIIDPNYDGALQQLMHRNLIFDNVAGNLWYEKFNRFGWINLFDYEQPCKEYVFITKPDLYICNDYNFNQTSSLDNLSEACKGSPLIREIYQRNPRILLELQNYVKNPDGISDPFMHLIPNHVTSKMDLPGLSAESHKSTPNNYGAGIDYRTHSLRSGYAFDFALSVKDTPTLDIYLLVKAYDEYMRMLRLGEIVTYHSTRDGDREKAGESDSIKQTLDHYQNYIIHKIMPEQFSVYKFIVGSDGETLLYWAKATGVYFVDVPRSEFSDPPNDGFKYSLSMHANFIEDMNPLILYDFNTITQATTKYDQFFPVYGIDGINNEAAKYARIFKVSHDHRTIRRKVAYDYRIKWTNTSKRSVFGGG